MSAVSKEKIKSEKLTILAGELLSQGDIEEGLEALKRSARIGDGKDTQTYLQIASNLYVQKDYKHAKIFVETFLEHWKSAEAYFILAAIESALGCKEKSIKDYETGIKIYKGNEISPYHECADLYVQAGKRQNACEMHKLALLKKSNDRKSITFLANYYISEKNYKKAAEYYKILVDCDAAEYIDYQRYGMCLYEMRDYVKSEEMYILAMEKYPVKDEKSMELKNIRNRTLKDSYKDIEKSEKEYKKILEEKHSSNAYFHLGNIEFIKGNYTEAAKLYEKAKEIFQKHRM